MNATTHPDSNDNMANAEQRADPIIRFDKTTKRFGSLTVLDELNLDIARQEKVSIIGSSGSGKSTLLRLLMTLEHPSDGVIYVDGDPLHHMEKNGKLVPANMRHIRNVRSKIGMVFQHFNLFPHMTVLQNIIEGPVHVLGLKRDEAVERADELLGMVGLTDQRDKRPAQLSGGQQQRVAIARSIAMRPSIMLFDEVTSALDPELVGEVLNTIRQIADEYSITMLMVTHEMGFAREFSDRVCFFDDGQICEQGLPSELFDNPQQPRLQQFLSAVLQ